MLIRNFRVNMGANASPDLDILTKWGPLKSPFGQSLGNRSVVIIDLDILMEVRM